MNLFTADYWRARAEETRIIGEAMLDPLCQQTMQDIAASYEALAERIEWLDSERHHGAPSRFSRNRRTSANGAVHIGRWMRE